MNRCAPLSLVQPLISATSDEGLMLIAFSSDSGRRRDPQAAPPEGEAMVRQLEEELKTTRGDLHNSIQELEAANEELKASNEEAVSVNEELAIHQ